MEYEYKVTNFKAEVTTADVRKGNAGRKVTAQLEVLLQEHARDGWELQGQYTFDVQVKGGCFDGLLKVFNQNTQDGDFKIYQLVFRRPM
ncbi:hypothetical protein B0G80_7399 [Paraburkholderia sp. BL6669N2]|uniref:hypothetical protein n=1 Tax=Paraburkholderia sp. BL6669N2 TaxID=1938807 RepID=UPI000E243B06|nr:hypothetical protein [Paraburkholderia sp. BL6669N2]REG50926.1 hypothetical protein B0G80_7399 [Paraburkholderia sp. BL6669N2]